jgi:isoquinoline 1-oxidoreductase
MQGDVEAALGSAERVLRAEFHIAYIQHAPMEPRAALAIWTDGKLEVHAGTQQPSRVRGELASAFRIDPADVRLIVPDSGGGFGGKHTGEVAVEAARLAKAAGKPVSLRWTREEEFSFAYFRPAGVIQIAAGLDADGKIVAWDFTNLNSGSSAIATPYSIPNARTEYRACNSPLREGSYRALASTANNFARETMMDELAVLQGEDPVAFRRRSLAPGRLLDVLEAAARRFGWRSRRAAQSGDRAVGIACGTEKGSYVATAVDVEIDRRLGTIRVRDICCAYECGKIQNPENLRSQVEGSLVMGMGGALTESIQFRDGKILNGRFSAYRAPRFEDAPPIECVLLDRPDLDSVGAGETPIVALAPAIASAVRAITGEPVRALPIRLGDSSNGRG